MLVFLVLTSLLIIGLLLLLVLLLLVLLLILLLVLVLLLVLFLLLVLLLFVLLIFLLLLLVLLLILLLFLLQFLEQLLDALLVFFCLGVFRARFQGGVVFGDGLFPIRSLAFLVLPPLALAEERVGKIEFRRRAQRGILGQRGARKILRRFVVVFEPVSGGSGVQLQGRRIGFHAQTAFKCLARFCVIARGVGFDSGRSGDRSRRQEEERNKCRHRETAPAFAHQCLQHEKADGRAERPLIALDGATGTVRRDVSLLHFADAFSGNERCRVVVQPCVKTTRRLGNFLHPGFVEFGIHDFPCGRIADELARAVGNLRSLRRTDTDGENTHALGRRLFGRGNAVRAQFLAVGNDDHRAGEPFGFSEGILGCGDRGC